MVDRRARGAYRSSLPRDCEFDLVQRTVESPWFISADTQDDLAEVYYWKGHYPGNAQLFVRVVVRQGKVVTAYALGRLKAGEKLYGCRAARSSAGIARADSPRY